MKYRLNLFALMATLCFVAGCATPSNDIAHNSGATATCHVCRYNNDLACVDIRVKDTTPRAEYQGTTYCFCSDDCRTAFLKKPEKYLPRR